MKSTCDCFDCPPRTSLADKVVGIVEDLLAEACKEHAAHLEKENAELERQIAELQAALFHIASWSEGPEVTGAFDEPVAAQIARRALSTHPTPESK